MSPPTRKPLRSLAVGVVVLAIVILGAAAAVPKVQSWLKPSEQTTTAANQQPKGAEAELSDRPNTLRLPEEISKKLGIKTGLARKPGQGAQINIDGSLALDPDFTHWARPRFGGEVVIIGTTPSAERDASGRPLMRALRVGDRVRKGELLAVVWSKDLGEKKSELLDALSQLRLDTDTLKRQEELLINGGIPIRTVEETRRRVAGDHFAVDKARRTLQVYRVSEEELQEIYKEEERLSLRRTQPGLEKPTNTEPAANWARVEMTVPFDGMVVERNVAPHDIVDTTTAIFKIANMDRLLVQANAYEESLRSLLDLTPPQLRWQVRVKADPEAAAMEGTIDQIRPVLDSATQTVFVVGHVDNSKGRLRSGQFITATVTLPAPEGVVSIPTSALVEDGWQSVVFTQPDPANGDYTMQRVVVTQRFREHALVRSQLAPQQQVLTPQDEKLGLLPFSTLSDGTLVVSAGCVELKAELGEQMAKAKK